MNDEHKTTGTESKPEITEPVKVSPAAPVPTAEGVTLTQEAFSALMKRLGDLESNAELMLQVQDTNKIKKIEDLRRAGKLVKSVKIRKYLGKYIVGWKTLVNEVYKDEHGRLVEKQTIEVYFDDSSKMEMALRQWAIAPEYVPFEVTKESKDADGNLFFTCVGPDGKEIELNASFIN